MTTMVQSLGYRGIIFKTYPISPIAGIIAISLAVEFLHHRDDCLVDKLTSITVACVHQHRVVLLSTQIAPVCMYMTFTSCSR